MTIVENIIKLAFLIWIVNLSSSRSHSVMALWIYFQNFNTNCSSPCAL